MEPLFIAVLALSAISASRAEESLFVRKGGSVRLDVQRYEQLRFKIIFWNFNISLGVLEYINKYKDLTFYKDYENRTEFDENNFSLLLKNVQERDSGIYTLKTTDDEGLKDVATYRLTVQEAPPTPQVRMSLLSSAGGFCNVSVNCSAKDTWASYTCDNVHCTLVANKASPTGVIIIVTATNVTVHCSSHNRVDTKTQSESTKTLCAPNTKKNYLVGGNVASLLGGIVATIIIFIIIIILLYKISRKSGGSQIPEMWNTEYDSVEGVGVALSNTSTEGTMYDTVTKA